MRLKSKKAQKASEAAKDRLTSALHFLCPLPEEAAYRTMLDPRRYKAKITLEEAARAVVSMVVESAVTEVLERLGKNPDDDL